MKIKLISSVRLRLAISFLLLALLTLAFIIKPAETVNNPILSSTTQNVNTQNISSPPSGNNGGNFLIAAMNDGFDQSFAYVNDSLGLNLWHYYIGDTTINGKSYPRGWVYLGIGNDQLFEPVSSYSTALNTKLGIISSHNMKAYLHRPKIDYLCFGQRSDYQCEEIAPYSTDLWFYSFQSPNTQGETVQDNTSYGGGIYVKRCLVSADEAGMVVSRLKTNTEQSHSNNGYAAYREDSQTSWHIKPRIRIDSTVAHNIIQNPLVCNIKVLKQDGLTELLNVDIHANDFLKEINGQFFYNGGYIEEFNFTGNTELKINGAWGDKWIYNSRGNDPVDDADENHADIQVYWYGNCDMWIDYVRVDNDIAHDLLTIDTTNQTHNTYLRWIKGEAEIAGSSQSAVNFYIELNEFNQIPCMAYVNQMLLANSHGKEIGLIADQFTSYQYHMSWEDRGRIMTAPQIARQYVNKIGLKQIYPGCYPFTSLENVNLTTSRIPNTLPRHSGDSVLAQDISPAEYDAWLQYQIDTVADFFEGTAAGNNPLDNQGPCPQMPPYPGMFRWAFRLANEISKEANVPIVADLQAHQWMVHCSEVDREPTNEELNMTTNLAITYGAKGIVYEVYDGSLLDGPGYTVGFTETDHSTPRKWNMYHQPKWDSLKSMIQRVKIWGPTLMSFDNTKTNSYIYRLDDEREACRQNEYFSSIATYYRGSSYNSCLQDNPGFPPYDGLIYDCAEQTYLQAATFENSSERNTNYFMIVNRRCSPLQPATHNDGERFIRMHFDSDHAELNGANNWKVTDVVSGWDTIFNKLNSAHVVNLGWFNPGEGRLYKMTPLPNSGGVLAGDEVITGESFTCEDTIFSNGYNITIGAGTNMKFTDSSCIVMNGGVFTMGDQQVSGPQNITFDAASGSSWRGHSFTGTEVHIYGASFTGLANDSVYVLNMINCPIVDIRNTAFNTAGSLKGGINAVYYADPMGGTPSVNFYTGGNTFTATGSTIPTVNVSSFAGVTTPLIIENNTFTNGNTAVFLTGITAEQLKVM